VDAFAFPASPHLENRNRDLNHDPNQMDLNHNQMDLDHNQIITLRRSPHRTSKAMLLISVMLMMMRFIVPGTLEFSVLIFRGRQRTLFRLFKVAIESLPCVELQCQSGNRVASMGIPRATFSSRPTRVK